MKSLRRLSSLSVCLPLAADEIIELHAARLLLLIHVCGVKNTIDGLTKMAKLDFFTRYPSFFNATTEDEDEQKSNEIYVESSMVRYHYGPWDKRYYHILSYLKAKRLIDIRKERKKINISLTDTGIDIASQIKQEKSYHDLVKHMKKVKKKFGNRSGTYIKKFIYDTFEKEVASKRLGEVIE